MEVEKREGEGNSYIFKLKECSETSEKSDCEVILKLFFKKTQFIYYTLKIYKNSTVSTNCFTCFRFYLICNSLKYNPKEEFCLFSCK